MSKQMFEGMFNKDDEIERRLYVKISIDNVMQSNKRIGLTEFIKKLSDCEIRVVVRYGNTNVRINNNLIKAIKLHGLDFVHEGKTYTARAHDRAQARRAGTSLSDKHSLKHLFERGLTFLPERDYQAVIDSNMRDNEPGLPGIISMQDASKARSNQASDDSIVSGTINDEPSGTGSVHDWLNKHLMSVGEFVASASIIEPDVDEPFSMEMRTAQEKFDYAVEQIKIRSSILHNRLVNDVRIVSVQPGYIEAEYFTYLPKSFRAKLEEALKDITGEVWSVHLTRASSKDQAVSKITQESANMLIPDTLSHILSEGSFGSLRDLSERLSGLGIKLMGSFASNGDLTNVIYDFKGYRYDGLFKSDENVVDCSLKGLLDMGLRIEDKDAELVQGMREEAEFLSTPLSDADLLVPVAASDATEPMLAGSSPESVTEAGTVASGQEATPSAPPALPRTENDGGAFLTLANYHPGHSKDPRAAQGVEVTRAILEILDSGKPFALPDFIVALRAKGIETTPTIGRTTGSIIAISFSRQGVEGITGSQLGMSRFLTIEGLLTRGLFYDPHAHEPLLREMSLYNERKPQPRRSRRSMEGAQQADTDTPSPAEKLVSSHEGDGALPVTHQEAHAPAHDQAHAAVEPQAVPRHDEQAHASQQVQHEPAHAAPAAFPAAIPLTLDTDAIIRATMDNLVERSCRAVSKSYGEDPDAKVRGAAWGQQVLAWKAYEPGVRAALETAGVSEKAMMRMPELVLAAYGRGRKEAGEVVARVLNASAALEGMSSR